MEVPPTPTGPPPPRRRDDHRDELERLRRARLPVRRRARRGREGHRPADAGDRGRRTEGQDQRRPPPGGLRRAAPHRQEGHVRLELGVRPSPGGGTCADGQGDAGLAIGTDAELTEHGQTKLPAPAGHSRIALCGEVPSWKTRVCVTQLGTSEDAQWRRKEAGTLATLAGKGRVLIGGDFADAPDSPALDPLYAAYAECDQTGSSRTGAKTRQNWQGTAVEKTDYLFIGKSASVSCTVPTANTKSSDHRPLSAVIRYP
ncbi:endonuclease/exonuclease/phosphatase family protein [Actinomadura madurae]|uniref:endonuclease/exonuclease/phosphatase family protein n=1 Tax=Actinomadura madurae TaxID=1993 RepID=UPI0020D22FD2|nr:hypothetical protein [Actinomadura madurae]MCQ0017488.1 hypothetical protein [Actinomadura madurae]